jgi:hypothetical protein
MALFTLTVRNELYFDEKKLSFFILLLKNQYIEKW